MSSASESFLALLTFGGNPSAGNSTTISINHMPTEFGQTTYQWNFGDGSTASGSSHLVYHTYAAAGTYQVTVTVSNPEYGSASASKPVIISPDLAGTLCVDGPQSGDRCNAPAMVYGECTSVQDRWAATSFLVTPTGGCTTGSMTYVWRYFNNAHPGGQTFGGNSPNATSPIDGYYSVTVSMSDGCGNEETVGPVYVNVYNSGCPID